MRYRLAAEASTVTVRTGTEGLFSRMAHRLELVAQPVDGRGEREGEVLRGALRVRAQDVHVSGVVRGDRVDAHVLTADDVAAIDARVGGELFGGPSTFDIEVDARAGGGTVAVSSPRGKATSKVRLSVVDEGASLRVTGEVRLSLRALGAGPVKGPLGAFRVADEVEVTFRGLFVPEAAEAAHSC